MSPATADLTRSLASAYTGFGFDLLGHVLGTAGGKNVLLSPWSIATALTMTYNGAAGDTQRAMAKVLGLMALSLDQVNGAEANLTQSLSNAGSNVQLAIANSLWLSRRFTFAPDFLDRNQRYFGARAETVDFADPATLRAINQWVSTSTKGKIPTILESIDPQTAMELVDAIYFKGLWQTPFDPARTKPGTFHVLNGDPIQSPLMTRSGNFPYAQGKNFQSVSLAYGDGRMTMDLFLPAAGVVFADFLKDLTSANWEQWLAALQPADGDVTLPRFKLSYQTGLAPILTALGMGVAMDPRTADFGEMSPTKGLYIGEVTHKAVAEVTEQGTEAAAVTSVGIQPMMARAPTTRFSFVADRPFFFAIRDNQTGALLFAGTVVNPS